MQPYNRPAGVEISKHSLWIVQRLSNEDKHRVVLPALGKVLDPDASPFDAVPSLEVISDIGAIGDLEFGSLGPGEQEAELYGANIEILGPKPRLRMNGTLPIELFYGEDRISNRHFESASNKVREVVTGFAPAFEGGGLGTCAGAV